MGFMDFGEAIRAMKDGHSVSRSGWNGKEMYIYIQKGSVITKDKARNLHLAGIDGEIVINSHVDMKAADGSIVIGWLASQTDMLAEDWMIVS
jgi:hypothetical protein